MHCKIGRTVRPNRSPRESLPKIGSNTSGRASQVVGIKSSSMDYDLGYFDLETRVLEPLEDRFVPKVLPM